MGKLILLVDDDNDELTIFSMAAAKAGFSCDYITAGDALKALQVLARATPACIFVDINLPGMDGITCVANIRQMRRLDNVPVIVYSNGVNESVYASAIAAGATDCIKKESSIDRQAENIGRILGKL